MVFIKVKSETFFDTRVWYIINLSNSLDNMHLNFSRKVDFKIERETIFEYSLVAKIY